MPIYEVLNQEKLIDLADKRGWIDDSLRQDKRVEKIPPVEFFSEGKRGALLEMSLENQSSVRMRIPTSVVHGGNFSLIIEDKIFPGGFVHSFCPSVAWKSVGNDHVSYQPKVLQRIKAKSPSLLGMVSHWGHFFVDALDRLFKLEELELLNTPLLVGDPDCFGLRPQVNDCHAVPQVSELMHLLGIDLTPGNVIPLFKQFDYQVSDLTLCTLESQKPAISTDSFGKIRQRVLGEIGQVSDGLGKLIFVGRADIKKRYILNQPEIMDYLEDRHDAATIFPEFMTIQQAVQAFSSASRLILPVGSAKFNLTFCRPGAKVVCITPKGYAALNGGVVMMVRHLCHAMGLRLAFYDVEIEETKPLVNSNMVISKADIDNIMSVFYGMV